MAEFPYPVRNPASIMEGKFGRLWVVGKTFCGYRVVYRHPNIEEQLGVKERVIYDWQMPLYPVLTLEESALQSLLLELKEDMLNQGASALAVQWVGEVSPFTKKELITMAEKLTKKAAPAKKAPAAKAKPAAKPAKAEGESKRGRAPSIDEKAKITATEKGKTKLGKVEKTDLLAVMVAAKTVGKAYEAGVASKDILYAQRVGLIELA